MFLLLGSCDWKRCCCQVPGFITDAKVLLPFYPYINFHYCCRRDTQNTLNMFIFSPFLAKSHDFMRTNQTSTDSSREPQRRFLRC